MLQLFFLFHCITCIPFHFFCVCLLLASYANYFRWSDSLYFLVQPLQLCIFCPYYCSLALLRSFFFTQVARFLMWGTYVVFSSFSLIWLLHFYFRLFLSINYSLFNLNFLSFFAVGWALPNLFCSNLFLRFAIVPFCSSIVGVFNLCDWHALAHLTASSRWEKDCWLYRLEQQRPECNTHTTKNLAILRFDQANHATRNFEILLINNL